MMPRAANEIFNDIAHDQLNECTVYMSYIQIYMEIVKDLLKPSSNNLSIREDTNGVYLAGVQEVQVSSTEDCLKLLQVGTKEGGVLQLFLGGWWGGVWLLFFVLGIGCLAPE